MANQKRRVILRCLAINNLVSQLMPRICGPWQYFQISIWLVPYYRTFVYVSILRRLSIQNYSQVFVLGKSECTLEMWEFAARYRLIELEQYYRSHQCIFDILKTLLSEIKDLRYFLAKGISAEIMEVVVRDLLKKTLNHEERSLGRCICGKKSKNNYEYCERCQREIDNF